MTGPCEPQYFKSIEMLIIHTNHNRIDPGASIEVGASGSVVLGQ